MIFRDKVKICRNTLSTTSGTGEPVYTSTVITASLSCNIQQPSGVTVRGMIDMAYAGATAIGKRDMYCNPTNIQEQDIVENLATGERWLVIEVIKHGVLPHYMIRLERGTV